MFKTTIKKKQFDVLLGNAIPVNPATFSHENLNIASADMHVCNCQSQHAIFMFTTTKQHKARIHLQNVSICLEGKFRFRIAS